MRLFLKNLSLARDVSFRILDYEGWSFYYCSLSLRHRHVHSCMEDFRQSAYGSLCVVTLAGWIVVRARQSISSWWDKCDWSSLSPTISRKSRAVFYGLDEDYGLSLHSAYRSAYTPLPLNNVDTYSIVPYSITATVVVSYMLLCYLY